VINFSFVMLGAFALADAFFRVSWTDGSQAAVSIKAEGLRPAIEECLDSGREAKVRMQMRLCRKRSSWFDACATERSEHHSINYDIITESYRVISDRHGDENDPVVVGVPERRQAVDATTTVDSLTLDFLARGDSDLVSQERGYLQARAVIVCKGSVNRTFAQLSQIVTLGLVNVKEEDSGWVDFPIKPSRPSSSVR
jgi:hypothetical protein